MQLQSIFDQIMPFMIPAALVGLIYWLLGKKKMTSVKAIWLVLFLGIILYNLKLLA